MNIELFELLRGRTFDVCISSQFYESYFPIYNIIVKKYKENEKLGFIDIDSKSRLLYPFLVINLDEIKGKIEITEDQILTLKMNDGATIKIQYVEHYEL